MTDDPITEQPIDEAATPQAPPDIKAIDALLFTIHMLSEQAWIHLGLRASPGSSDTKTDLPEARLLIDALNALVPLTEGHLDGLQLRDLKNLLATLQLNYVQRLP